jgi:hypothetical protein
LEFRGQDGRELPPFDPGAHLSVRVPNGIVRKYSLCNDPSKRDTIMAPLPLLVRQSNHSIFIANRLATSILR